MNGRRCLAVDGMGLLMVVVTVVTLFAYTDSDETSPKNGDCLYVDKTLHPPCVYIPPNQQNLCQVDGQCNGTDKCCFVNCKGMQCVPPAPVFIKPGCCPAQKPVACVVPTPENQANDCNSDGTCPSNQKCCKPFCFGNRCMNPA